MQQINNSMDYEYARLLPQFLINMQICMHSCKCTWTPYHTHTHT